MDHHRPSVRRCGGLDPAQESQQSGGVVRHPVLRPGGEVELAHLVFGRVTSLEETSGTSNEMLVAQEEYLDREFATRNVLVLGLGGCTHGVTHPFHGEGAHGVLCQCFCLQ